MNIVAQIFGFIALLVYITSLQTNNKRKLLIFLIIANAFYSLQYLMLDAYAAIFVCLIGIFRCVVFLKFEKEGKEIPLYVLLVILFLITYSSVLSYNGLLSLIPLSMGVIYSWAVWQTNMQKFRMVCIINAVSWMFYNYMVGAYVAIFSSALELLFSLIAFIKFYKKR